MIPTMGTTVLGGNGEWINTLEPRNDQTSGQKTVETSSPPDDDKTHGMRKRQKRRERKATQQAQNLLTLEVTRNDSQRNDPVLRNVLQVEGQGNDQRNGQAEVK